MTNQQSYVDGKLSDDEYRWLTMRAQGGFGMTMTCASHVQARGQGFPGQLGCWSDEHIEGLARLADGIRSAGSVSSLQLHHAGFRSPSHLISGQPVGPSDHAETGSRAMTLDEVQELRDDFIRAAIRAEKAGFDGVQIHGAHGYVLCSFLSKGENLRTDEYGNRSRLLVEILDGIRAATRADFQVGIRLSPDRFGLETEEVIALAGQLLVDERLDYLDISVWDYARDYQGENLFGRFAALPRKGVLLGVAGKLYSAEDCRAAIGLGADFLSIGKAGILHHDFPLQVRKDSEFVMRSLPVTREYLLSEGVSETFVNYMARWEGFVQKDEA